MEKKQQPAVKINLATKLRMEKSNPYIHFKTEIEKLKKTKENMAAPKDSKNEFKENRIPKTTSQLYDSRPKSKINSIRPTTAGVIKTEKNGPKKIVNDQKVKPNNDILKKNANSINFIERNKQMLKEKKMSQLNISKANQSDLKMKIPTIKISRPTSVVAPSTKFVPKITKKPDLNNINSRQTILKKETMATSKIVGNKVPNEPNNRNENHNKQEPEKSRPNSKPQETRRSLSAVHFKRIKTKDMNAFRHRSTEGLNAHMKKPVNIRTPIREETLDFHKRRSVAVSAMKSSHKKKIFNTPDARRTTIIHSEVEVQWDSLKKWLEKKGKPIGNYHHIQCFGAHLMPYLKDYNEENKENFDGLEWRSESYENLHIEKETAPCKPDPKDLFKIANDALHDLQKLILEGYPRESCEAWLDLIKSKFSQVEDYPQYWECRAALEETCKNFSNAIDYYQEAIKKGADINHIDESLDPLLKKFQVLNISLETEKTDEDANALNKSKRKNLVESRNVFKSSIINFAVKEKKTEDAEKSFQFFATPVRRSTRLSRPAKYTSTPGVKLCSTLDELEESTRDSIYFKSNKALV